MDGPEPLRADAPNGIGISFFTANGLYSDPCHWDVKGTGDAAAPGDVKVGPTVDDLVAAVRANTFYTSSTATPVTIDGYAGKELEIQLPDDPYTRCDKDDPSDPGGHEFVFSGPGLYAQGRANRWHLYILDVDGTRLIAVILSYAKTPQADLDVARNVIETMDIQARLRRLQPSRRGEKVERQASAIPLISRAAYTSPFCVTRFQRWNGRSCAPVDGLATGRKDGADPILEDLAPSTVAAARPDDVFLLFRPHRAALNRREWPLDPLR
jgi:hypothetical protein